MESARMEKSANLPRRRLPRLLVLPIGVAVIVILWVAWSLHLSAVEAGRIELAVSVQSGLVGDVRALLEQGWDPNTRVTRNEPQPGLLETLKRLFRFRRQSELGPTLLHLAVHARPNRYEVEKLLVERGADVNAVDTGWTPLMSAVSVGDKPTIRYLLSHGANVHLGRNWRGTVQSIARESGDPEIVRLVNEASNVTWDKP
jgi:hypothetical protein